MLQLDGVHNRTIYLGQGHPTALDIDRNQSEIIFDNSVLRGPNSAAQLSVKPQQSRPIGGACRFRMLNDRYLKFLRQEQGVVQKDLNRRRLSSNQGSEVMALFLRLKRMLSSTFEAISNVVRTISPARLYVDIVVFGGLLDDNLMDEEMMSETDSGSDAGGEGSFTAAAGGPSASVVAKAYTRLQSIKPALKPIDAHGRHIAVMLE
ncbi:hypothetical protein BGZ47_004401 [Haplosporangium gracile]|nr:hypothetical protein BGZ47_004401 [Haplosporangium gracile]